jgi:hypothetical protein
MCSAGFLAIDYNIARSCGDGNQDPDLSHAQRYRGVESVIENPIIIQFIIFSEIIIM